MESVGYYPFLRTYSFMSRMRLRNNSSTYSALYRIIWASDESIIVSKSSCSITVSRSLSTDAVYISSNGYCISSFISMFLTTYCAIGHNVTLSGFARGNTLLRRYSLGIYSIYLRSINDASSVVITLCSPITRMDRVKLLATASLMAEFEELRLCC